ncbi:hypothetical protein GE061_009313 [Apolygus lucorum]|uniref:DUF3824 domain-containing protein n=1 Tax=Apolygus lucorum TaxID=248454 RepID=A0A6A4K4H7_APOLU|nr:hypothetical protein GE061_009313 [Apolygus lucorum]
MSLPFLFIVGLILYHSRIVESDGSLDTEMIDPERGKTIGKSQPFQMAPSGASGNDVIDDYYDEDDDEEEDSTDDSIDVVWKKCFGWPWPKGRYHPRPSGGSGGGGGGGGAGGEGGGVETPEVPAEEEETPTEEAAEEEERKKRRKKKKKKRRRRRKLHGETTESIRIYSCDYQDPLDPLTPTSVQPKVIPAISEYSSGSQFPLPPCHPQHSSPNSNTPETVTAPSSNTSQLPISELTNSDFLQQSSLCTDHPATPNSPYLID